MIYERKSEKVVSEKQNSLCSSRKHSHFQVLPHLASRRCFLQTSGPNALNYFWN